MSKHRIAGRWALVTGGSSGLGQDLARELAAREMNTILVARRQEPMDALADELRGRHHVEVDVLATDLSRAEAPAELYRQVRARGRQVDVLINNAGFGVYGGFLDLPWDRQQQLLDVNVRALLHLTWLFGREMAARGFGRIMQVASMAGFQAIPWFTLYSASKAMVLLFGEGLHAELRRSGVTCTVLCPGTTRTDFFAAAGHQLNRVQLTGMMESADVARIGIRAMLAGKGVVVPGRFNRLVVTLSQLLPRWLVVRLAARSMRPGQ